MTLHRHTPTQVARAVPAEPYVLPSHCLSPQPTTNNEQRTTLNPHAAFTLIELLISVMIFGIVLIAINTVFYSALRLRNRTAAIIDTSHTLEQALAFLRRDLQGLVPPSSIMAPSFKIGPVSAQGTTGTATPATSTGSGSGGVTTTGVSAALDNGTTGGALQTPGLQFYTTTGIINDLEPWGDLQRVTYQLQDATDRNALGKDLVRSINRNVLATTMEDPIEQRLLSNIESLEVECYTGIEWRTLWDTTLTDVGLPTAVRLRIHFATENTADTRNRQPLEMIMPLFVQSVTNQTQSTQTTGGMQ